jgi:hypothetical protein
VKVTRRKHLHQLGAALLAPCGIAALSPLFAAQANPPAWRQGLSLFGDLKYPAKFPRFDYASSSAPTGGRVRQGALGSYDNFNMVMEGARGNLAVGIELIYDTLLLPDVPPDGFEKCVSQLRGYWFVHGLTRRDARCLTCGPGYKRPVLPNSRSSKIATYTPPRAVLHAGLARRPPSAHVGGEVNRSNG